MTQPYSEDLRERALARYEAGETIRAIGDALGISSSCVSKWRKLRRETGSLQAGKMGGHKKPVLSGGTGDWLEKRVRSGPFTLRALVAELAERGVKTDHRAVWTFVRAKGLSFKKTMRAPEQTRPAVARNRLRWKNHQDKVDPRRLVFIDEPWVKTNMAPLRGWGPRGQRLVAHAPQGRWRTLTVIAALRHDRVTAPGVIDGPINGAIFRRYVESVLVPILKPKDVVVLDNLGSHKGEAARAAIRAAGAHLLFLPPYSPDLNPIEQLFAKLKHLVRKAEPRTVEETGRRLGKPLDLFSPDECANSLKNSGYASV